MKKLSLSFYTTTLALTSFMAYAMPEHDMPMEAHDHLQKAPAPSAHQFAAAIKMEGELHAGNPTPVVLTLTHSDSGKPVLPEEINIAHTRRVHLLVVDPSLSDYQHIHPTPDNNGEWNFTFTPKKEGSYRIWADVTPAGTGKQEYLKTDIGTPLKNPPPIDKVENNKVTVEGYTFTLNLEGALKAKEATMGSVTITDQQGKPVTKLQPVMGAYAHVVGFGEDHNSILHVHPMGTEPQKDTERGGPTLEFHIEPATPGFIKLFVQTKIDDKDIFAPFGVMVK